jgi:hypothetical protein
MKMVEATTTLPRFPGEGELDHPEGKAVQAKLPDLGSEPG